jgi:hypothetical protein
LKNRWEPIKFRWSSRWGFAIQLTNGTSFGIWCWCNSVDTAFRYPDLMHFVKLLTPGSQADITGDCTCQECPATNNLLNACWKWSTNHNLKKHVWYPGYILSRPETKLE